MTRDTAIPALFTPLQLRDVQIRNRIWIPPMCQYTAVKQDGKVVDWHIVNYGSYARGGAGLVTVEATAVVPEGRITPQDLGIWSDDQVEGLQRLAAAIADQGATPAIQLAHAGRKASALRGFPGEDKGPAREADGGWEAVAPSPNAFPGLSLPRALDEGGIHEVIEAFVAAAQRAVKAGFKLVEIHGAHGYLLHEFLSPLSNQRQDSYGGDLENRARFLLEVTSAVRAAIDANLALAVRLSATEWVSGGFSLEETVIVADWLKARGVDLISVSSGGNVAKAPIPSYPGYQVPLAAQVHEEVDIPVAVAGQIVSAAQAEYIVAAGQADAVYVGRESMRNPNFPLTAAQALGFTQAYVPPQYLRAHL